MNKIILAIIATMLLTGFKEYGTFASEFNNNAFRTQEKIGISIITEKEQKSEKAKIERRNNQDERKGIREIRGKNKSAEYCTKVRV
uniref:Uncharacterized protein n=1 Tax=Dulem virus 55 TaxID=3145766 RepID=A0AAU8B2W2_9VIRU